MYIVVIGYCTLLPHSQIHTRAHTYIMCEVELIRDRWGEININGLSSETLQCLRHQSFSVTLTHLRKVCSYIKNLNKSHLSPKAHHKPSKIPNPDPRPSNPDMHRQIKGKWVKQTSIQSILFGTYRKFWCWHLMLLFASQRCILSWWLMPSHWTTSSMN